MTTHSQAEPACSADLERLSLEAILDTVSLGVVLVDMRRPGQPVVRINAAFTALTGYEPGHILGRNCRILQGPDTDPQAMAAVAAAIASGEPVRQPLLNYRRDGTPVWIELNLTPIPGPDGSVVGYIGIQRDITEELRVQRTAASIESRLRVIAEHFPGFLFQFRQRPEGPTELTYCSPSLNRLLEIEQTPKSLGGFLPLVHPDDAQAFRGAIEVAGRNGGSLALTCRLTSSAGRIMWVRIFAGSHLAADGQLFWDGCALDITAEREAEARAAWLIGHDPLTGLVNLRGFETSLADRLARAGAAGHEPERPTSLFLVQVAEVPDIRQTLGPATADALIAAVAERVQALAGGSSDVARIGDGRFALAADLAPEDRERLARTLAEALDRRFVVGGRPLSVRAEIGLAEYAGDRAGRETGPAGVHELITRAEIALAEARHGQPVVYTRDIDERVSRRVVLRQSMAEALERGQFEVHYQPICELATERLVGAEALVRWRHPELGVQRPDEFIALAEDSGLIVPLGEFVLETAMRAARRWDAAHLGSPRISVNVSGVQLRRSDFPAAVERLLAETGVDPRRIELELTEGYLFTEADPGLASLARLRQQGIALAIDDFGAGYASYGRLKTLPVDRLKIDQAFIGQLSSEATDASIVRAILAMARSLGLEVVCEGIETRVQLDFLLQEGCRLGQGYHFARPMPAREFEHLLQRLGAAGRVSGD